MSPDTIRNWVKRGYIPAYTVKGRRGLLINVEEARRELARQPRTRARTGYGSYGPKARIVALTPKAAASNLPVLSDEQASKVATLLSGRVAGQ